MKYNCDFCGKEFNIKPSHLKNRKTACCSRKCADKLKIQNKEKNRLNEVRENNKGTIMKIVEYNEARNIVVEFQDEYKFRINCRYNDFLKGNVSNPYDKTLCGVGYIGVGKYSPKTHPYIYRKWHEMIMRCYNCNDLERMPTYKNIFVEDYLLNFQNFAEWMEQNYYEIPNEKMVIDKDILEKGNKVYDREHMVFVPEKINTLFIKCDKSRGNYPIGVSEGKNILYVHCSKDGKQKYLGSFPLNKPFQAFTIYKNFKENHIKEMANKYKNLIPEKLYEAMYKWEVEIND